MNTSNLSKAFHLRYQPNSQDDLVAAYLKLFQNSFNTQNDGDEGIYKKWMPFPQIDYAYFLDISKPFTLKKINDFIGNALEDISLGTLRYYEIIRDQKRIRIVMVNSKTRSKDQMKEIALIHCIGEEQMVVQEENMSNIERRNRRIKDKNNINDITMKDYNQDEESGSISTDCNSDSLPKTRKIIKKKIRQDKLIKNILQKRLKIQQEGEGKVVDDDDNQEVSSSTEVLLSNQLSRLLETLSRKKMKINSLKIEQGIANERIRVQNEKLANLEILFAQKDNEYKIVTQENIQKDKQIQDMQLLLKVRSQEIDLLNSEHRIHEKLQKEVIALCAGSEELRQQLKESQKSQMNYVKEKGIFKKKLEAEIMNKDRYIRKCEKKQLKIKELKYRVEALEQKEKAADMQRENDNKHFQQLQEYLVKELNTIKEEKETVQNEFERYKRQQRYKNSQKNIYVKNKNNQVDEKEKQGNKIKDDDENNNNNNNNRTRKSQRIADRLSSCEGTGSSSGSRDRRLSEGEYGYGMKLKKQQQQMKRDLIFIDESPKRNRDRSINKDKNGKISINNRGFDSQIEECSESNIQQQITKNNKNRYANQNSLFGFKDQQNGTAVSNLNTKSTPEKNSMKQDSSCSSSRSRSDNSRIELSASQVAVIEQQKAFNQRIIETNENSAVKLDKIKRCCDEFKELCQLAKVATNSLEIKDNRGIQQQYQNMFQGDQRSNNNSLFSPLKENQRFSAIQGRRLQFNQQDGDSKKY